MRITAITYHNYYSLKTRGGTVFSGKRLSNAGTVLDDIRAVKSRGGSVPEGVEKLAKDYAGSGLRLNDIHKMYYKGLMECKTLDEAKEKYPEFSNVKHLNEVDAKPKGTLYCLQNGLVTGFDKDDDVPLRLLQEHWFNMRAIQDLPGIYRRKDTSGRLLCFENVYARLNIPKMNRQYIWEAK